MWHSLWVWFWVWFLVWSVGSWRVVLRPSSSSFVRCCCLFFVRVPSSVGCVVFLLLFRLLVPGRSSVACPCWVGVFVVGLGFGCFGFWFGCAVGFAGFLCRHRDLLTIALPPIEWPGYACSNVRQLYSRAVRVERKKAWASTSCWCLLRRRGLRLYEGYILLNCRSIRGSLRLSKGIIVPL